MDFPLTDRYTELTGISDMQVRDDIRRNGSGYRDDTAYEAIRNVEMEERRKRRRETVGKLHEADGPGRRDDR